MNYIVVFHGFEHLTTGSVFGPMLDTETVLATERVRQSFSRKCDQYFRGAKPDSNFSSNLADLAHARPSHFQLATRKGASRMRKHTIPIDGVNGAAILASRRVVQLGEGRASAYIPRWRAR